MADEVFGAEFWLLFEFTAGSHADQARESGQAGNRAAISESLVVRGKPGHLFSRNANGLYGTGKKIQVAGF